MFNLFTTKPTTLTCPICFMMNTTPPFNENLKSNFKTLTGYPSILSPQKKCSKCDLIIYVSLDSKNNVSILGTKSHEEHDNIFNKVSSYLSKAEPTATVREEIISDENKQAQTSKPKMPAPPPPDHFSLSSEQTSISSSFFPYPSPPSSSSLPLSSPPPISSQLESFLEEKNLSNNLTYTIISSGKPEIDTYYLNYSNRTIVKAYKSRDGSPEINPGTMYHMTYINRNSYGPTKTATSLSQNIPLLLKSLRRQLLPVSSEYVVKVLDVFTDTTKNGSPIYFITNKPAHVEENKSNRWNILFDEIHKERIKYSIQDLQMCVCCLSTALQDLHKYNIIIHTLSSCSILVDRNNEKNQSSKTPSYSNTNKILPVFRIDRLFGWNDITAHNCQLEYVAPEILDPKTSSTPSRNCDVWSLGVVLYEMISGKNPFRTQRDSISSSPTLELINRTDYYLKKEEYKDVNGDFIALVNYMMNEDPSKRPSIEEVFSRAMKLS